MVAIGLVKLGTQKRLGKIKQAIRVMLSLCVLYRIYMQLLKKFEPIMILSVVFYWRATKYISVIENSERHRERELREREAERGRMCYF